MPILNLTITEKGYRAMFARYPQVRLKLVRADFGEYVSDYVPEPTQESLVGDILYSTTTINRNINYRNDMVFKIVVPDTAPNAVYYEIGLFAENHLGESFLFAIGVLPSGYVKDKDFQILFVCYLKPPVNNYSVEFEANTLAEIPVAESYHELPPANRTGPNVWTVRKGRECGPALVCKVGDMNEWGIINGSKVFYGNAEVTGTKVDVPIDLTGMDAAMFTVVRGTGVHQTRRINTLKQLDRQLATDLDESSIVAIWTGPGCC